MKRRMLSILLAVLLVFGALPAAVFAEAECAHNDADGNGRCDECGIAVEASVTLCTFTPVTKTLKAGTNIKEAMEDILASQESEAAAMFYADGTPVGDADTLPYGYDLLEIYPLLYYKAEKAVCGEDGHKAYYYNTLDKVCYEDEDCTKIIGFDNLDGLSSWLVLEGGGMIEATAEHEYECCEDVVKGHVCTNEDCKYYGKPEDHNFSADDTYCVDCGAHIYKVCNNDPTCSDFYACANTFVNDGQPLKYVWYYVAEDVTLEEPLIIAGEDVRLIVANGVTFKAELGYHCLPGCSFEVYYQSREPAVRGSFDGMEYKCYDAEADGYYSEHAEITDYICSRCGGCVCEHKNIEETYEWSADYSSCHGKGVCEDCGAVLYESDSEARSAVTKKGNCQTKTQITYTAYFDYGYAQKTVDTEYGAHDLSGSGSVYCRKCYGTDVIGTKANFLKKTDVICSVTGSDTWLQLREELKAAKTVEELSAVLSKYTELTGELSEDDQKLIAAKTEIYDNIRNAAWDTKYPSSSYKLIMSFMPLFESANSVQMLSNIEVNLEKELTKLESDKEIYIKNTIDTYFDDGVLLLDESEFYQVYYGIHYATTLEDIIDAFNSPTVEGAKKLAKQLIDEAAGENQSLLMQKLVKNLKKTIDDALTKEEVKALKAEAIAAVEALLLKEAEDLTEFEEAKEKAKKAIDDAAGEDPTDTVATVSETAKGLIDAANTVDEVIAVRDKWTAVIKGLVSDAAAKALEDAKTAAKAAIENAADGVFDEISDYADAIDALESVTAVIEKLAAILGEIGDEKIAKATDEAQAALDKVYKELADEKADLEKAEKDLEEANTKITALQNDLDKAKDEKAKLEDLLDKKQKELDEAIINHSDEAESLKEEIAGLQKTISEKDDEINAKQAAIDSLNSQLDAAKKEIAQLKGQGGGTGSDTCPKCGGTHADNFWGKIVCFFNRIGNFFRNLFK